MILGSIFLFLGFLALSPVLLIVLGNCEGASIWLRMECVLSEYSGIVISLGTLFLVSGLALFTTYLSNSASKRESETNLKVAQALKLADFRQSWINKMREDMTEFSVLSFVSTERDLSTDETAALIRLATSIEMRLNHTECLAKEIRKSMFDMYDAEKEKNLKLTAVY